MLASFRILAVATQLSFARTRAASLVVVPKNAPFCFQSLTHSLQSQFLPILNRFCSLRTLCQKHPGVGVAPPAPIADFPFRALTRIESKRFTKNVRNHLRIKTFRDTPGGWVYALSLHRAFAISPVLTLNWISPRDYFLEAHGGLGFRHRFG